MIISSLKNPIALASWPIREPLWTGGGRPQVPQDFLTSVLELPNGCEKHVCCCHYTLFHFIFEGRRGGGGCAISPVCFFSQQNPLQEFVF